MFQEIFRLQHIVTLMEMSVLQYQCFVMDQINDFDGMDQIGHVTLCQEGR